MFTSRPQTVAHPGFGKGGPLPGVWGVKPQPPTDFYGFHIKKHSFWHTFFIEKGRAVSAGTTDNAKKFWQLMSKSRGLAKICERTTIISLRNYRLKVRF